MRNLLLSWLDAIYGVLAPEYKYAPGEAEYHFWKKDADWYYGLLGANNRLLSASTQGYASRGAVLRAISQHRQNAVTNVEREVGKIPSE